MGREYISFGFNICHDGNIDIIFIKYFVDENKYIMEGVAMFSLFKLTQQAKTFANKGVGMNLPVYDFNDLIIRRYSNASDFRILI